MSGYTWRIGDVFTDGTSRWQVVSIDDHDERLAVLKSLQSKRASTVPITFEDFREGGKWQLERKAAVA